MSFNNASDNSICIYIPYHCRSAFKVLSIPRQASKGSEEKAAVLTAGRAAGWVGSEGAVRHRGGTDLWDGREQSGERGEWSSKREVRSSTEKDGMVKRWVETIFLRYRLNWGELSLLLQVTPGPH